MRARLPLLLALTTTCVARAAFGFGDAATSSTSTASGGLGAPRGLGLIGSLRAERSDPAWERYDRAFRALARGNFDAAKKELEALREAAPEHPAAGRAEELLEIIGGEETRRTLATARLGAVDPFAKEEVSGLARAELTSFQTIAGIGVGLELCLVAECDDARAIVGAMTAGGVAGLTLALALTTGGITPGGALSIDSATSWGIWNGVALAAAADVDDAQAAFGVILAGHLVGLAAGAATYKLARPRAGDVSLVNTLGIWSGVLALFAHGAADFRADEETIFGTLVLATDLGLAAGVALTALDVVRMSRGRALVIDSGGLVGMLLGMGLVVLAAGDDFEAEAFFGAAMAGTVLGLGTTAFLTREWDVPESPVSVGFIPVESGGVVALGGSF